MGTAFEKVNRVKSLIPFKYQMLLLAVILALFVAAFMLYDLPGEYVKQGDRHYDAQEYDYAVLNYEQALRYDRENPEVYFKLARGEAARGEPLRAASAYTKAIEPGYTQLAAVYTGLGWTQYSLAQYDDAANSFERAIEIISANENQYTHTQLAEAYSGRGWVAIVQDGCEKAISYFDRALTLDAEVSSLNQGIRQCDVENERGTDVFE